LNVVAPAAVGSLDPRNAGIAGKIDSAQALTELCRLEMEACNRAIVARMQSPVELIPRLAAHLVAAGGKRIRPLLTIASARMCGYRDGPRHVSLAACVEFIHTATLLHDDVVDESPLRRGRASANAVFGNQASVLVGDFLFSRAFELMVEDGSLPVLAVLSRASSTIAEGEVLQLSTQNDLSTTEESYLEVVRCKTAALFAAATRVGGLVAGATAVQVDALDRYGLELGIAFQMVDDALDYGSDSRVMGKARGDDFREGKVTLPVLLAYARGSAPEREFWVRTIETMNQAEGDLETALSLIERHGALDEVRRRAGLHAARACEALDELPDGPERQALFGIAREAVARQS